MKRKAIKSMKRAIRFSLSGNRCLIEAESPRQYQREGEAPELSICGTFDGGTGQCVDAIRNASGGDERVERLCDIWDEYHLKAAPAPVLSELESILNDLSGKYVGEAPDVSDAPEIYGVILDSRDVIRAAEIYAAAIDAMGIDRNVSHENWPDHIEPHSDEADIIEEFIRLRELDEAGQSASGDWLYGATMIRDDHFTDYAEQLAYDIGALNKDASWPNNCINWDDAAEQLKMDYSTVHWNGNTYYVR